MFPLAKGPFGNNIARLSAVNTTVLKMCISLTIPFSPCASIKPSTLNGMKNRIMTSSALFPNAPENAIPMANPAAPKSAMKEVISIPIWLAANSATNIFNVVVATIYKKLDRPGSILLFFNPL